MTRNRTERFTETQMLKLVKLYKEKDCLWDVSHELYCVKEARDNAYESIWKELNIPTLTVKDVPQKIKNLRSSYYQELKRIEFSVKKGATGDAVYKPKVSWFSIADSFFKTFPKTPGFIIRPQVENEDYTLNSDSDSTPETINTLDTIAKKVSPRPNYFPQDTLPTQHNKKPQIKNEEDEFDSFGKYIATTLRSMPSEMSIISKTELQKTLADIQLRILRQGNQAVQPECCASTSNAEEDLFGHFSSSENVIVNIKTEFEEDCGRKNE